MTQVGSMDYANVPNTYGGNPYYVRCFDANSTTPLNGKRVQFPSQEGTGDIDPQLPQLNITDAYRCEGMHYKEINKITKL